ncbi:SDR family oxidoreductase [Candidatus Omnitrophota bacterium]
MKLLLVGASGVLGRRLYNDAIKKKWNVLGTYCSHECDGLFPLDLKDKKSVEKVFNFFNPEVMVLAGGITNVDLCESKPKFAEEVNIKSTLNLMKKAKERGAKSVFLSTDYIFDGENGPYKEDDKPAPVNVYGRTKLEAEYAIKGILKDYLIVRTAQLYGPDHQSKNFTVKIIHNMQNNKKIYAADDFYCTPTYVGSLSASIIELITNHKTGVYHAAGTDFINRYEYVDKIADVFMLSRDVIERVKLKDLYLKAKRPKKAGLKIDKIKKETKTPLYNCEEGLKLLKKEIGF